jgi:hypothetical protein
MPDVYTGAYIYEAYTPVTGTRYFTRLKWAKRLVERVAGSKAWVDDRERGWYSLPGLDVYVHRHVADNHAL